MNFVVGYILLVNGGNEEEAFWFFVNLLQRADTNDTFKGGISSFYTQGFPLLIDLMSRFDHVFSVHLPDLHAHFQTIALIP